jgi:hypothetical protein
MNRLQYSDNWQELHGRCQQVSQHTKLHLAQVRDTTSCASDVDGDTLLSQLDRRATGLEGAECHFDFFARALVTTAEALRASLAGGRLGRQEERSPDALESPL